MNVFIVVAILASICVMLSIVIQFVQEQPLTSQERHLQQCCSKVFTLIGLLGFIIYILVRNGWNGMNSVLLVFMYVAFVGKTIRSLYKTRSPG